MAGEWTEATWGDVATLAYGKAVRGYTQIPGEARVFGTNGPIGWHTEKLWDGPGVIIGRKGAYRGVHYTELPYWVIDTAYSLKPKYGMEIDLRWAYYQIKHLDPNTIDDGSPIPSTTRSAFYAQPLRLPGLIEQRAIANVLGSLDDKIELDNRIAATASSLLQAIFKSWFVDFDPVRANADRLGGPPPEGIRKLFPTTFDGNGLPDGWAVSTVGDLFEISGGNTPSTADPNNWDGPHQWATPKDLSSLTSPVLLKTERRITDAGLARSTSGLLPTGTLLLSSRAPIGYMAFTTHPVAINQGFAGFVRKDISPAYAWAWCHAYMETIRGNAGGSTFPEISKSVLRSLPMLRPSEEVLAAFNAAAEPLVGRMIAAVEEASNLAALRDALLPRLISGALRIGDAERAVAAA